MAAPNVGDAAPPFDLPGSGRRNYALEDYRGSGVILAFYPGDFTTVCTRQFCSYRDDADRIGQLGVELLGISPQSVSSHERFTEKHGLTVPLLADEGKDTARAYGCMLPGGVVRRSIFVIDAELVIRYASRKALGLSYERVGELEEAVATLR